MNSRKLKKHLILLLPYIILGLVCTNLGEAWRMAEGEDFGNRLVSCFGMIAAAFGNPQPAPPRLSFRNHLRRRAASRSFPPG